MAIHTFVLHIDELERILQDLFKRLLSGNQNNRDVGLHTPEMLMWHGAPYVDADVFYDWNAERNDNRKLVCMLQIRCKTRLALSQLFIHSGQQLQQGIPYQHGDTLR